MRLLLVRHGHTTDNEALIFSGQCDVPLSPLGERQASALSRRLASAPIAAIYSSDLIRAHATARAVAEPHGLPVEALSALREIALGAWEGKKYAEIVADDPARSQRWFDQPDTFAPPGGETAAAVRQRVRHALATHCTHHEDSTIAWVTHGGVVGVLLCDVLGLPTTERWRLRCDPASLTTLDIVSVPVSDAHLEASIACLNDTCHLEDLG